jgi:succinate dehydrogenase/fumarate reductase flavoprotein subunit
LHYASVSDRREWSDRMTQTQAHQLGAVGSASQSSGSEIKIYDVVVIGAGAGGLAAAVVAACEGLKVLVLEKTPYIGGTSAISGGACWLPNNSHSAAVGRPDDAEQVRIYLRQFLGNRYNDGLIDAFLTAAPKVVEYLETRTEVKFQARALSPDYRPDLPGAALGGRVLDPLEYDGRKLGPYLQKLRKPLPEYTAFNGMMVNKLDAAAFLGAHKSVRKFLRSSVLMTRYIKDRITHGRGTRLLLGASLIARLLRSALDKGVEIRVNAETQQLLMNNGRVTGLSFTCDGKQEVVRARAGVVLATGGMPGDRALKTHLVPHAEQHLSVPPATNDGGGLRLAQVAGGHLKSDGVNSYFFAPISTTIRADGSRAIFPHLVLDRQKPGLIAVNTDGNRFTNESSSYHDFVEAMHRENAVPAYLICDSRFIRKYGLGLVHPGPLPLGGHVRSGYLTKARTIGEMAAKLGVNSSNLERAVSRNNDFAETGEDLDFGRGSTIYNRFLGDDEHKPNPCIGPILRAPFYAVKVYPGDIGSAAGIEINSSAQVVDDNGKAVPGLFASGNDSYSIFAGTYPGAGTTLGPALALGYIAAMAMKLEKSGEQAA